MRGKKHLWCDFARHNDIVGHGERLAEKTDQLMNPMLHLLHHHRPLLERFMFQNVVRSSRAGYKVQVEEAGPRKAAAENAWSICLISYHLF